jgi:hypothetical protein
MEMKERVSLADFGLQYREFLFTSLGDDRNGTPLALASVLGRMNLDPWHEAASLAALPADVAARRLTSLIEAIPGQALNPPESATLAARLIALLPARPKAEAPRPDLPEAVELPEAAGPKTNRRPVVYVIWFAIIFVVVLALSASLVTGGR